MKFSPANNWSLLALAAIALAVSGCGSGTNGGRSQNDLAPQSRAAFSLLPHDSPSPTPISDPTPSPVSAPVALPNIVATASGDTVRVTWESLPTISVSSVVEYHVYRDGQIIGIATPGTNAFVDDLPSGTPAVFAYEALIGSTLEQIAVNPPALAPGVPHLYMVTELYDTPNASGGGFSFHEAEVGDEQVP